MTTTIDEPDDSSCYREMTIMQATEVVGVIDRFLDSCKHGLQIGFITKRNRRHFNDANSFVG
jgi:hypothetical protein